MQVIDHDSSSSTIYDYGYAVSNDQFGSDGGRICQVVESRDQTYLLLMLVPDRDFIPSAIHKDRVPNPYHQINLHGGETHQVIEQRK